MFSIHVFATFLVIQSLLAIVLKAPIFGYCKVFKRCRKSDVTKLFVQGTLRIMLTGFLEIFLCSIIGLWLFKTVGFDNMTDVDKASAYVTIFYLVCSVLFVILLCLSVFWLLRPVIRVK